jgi:catechol 2,3-dioxygenase-like lactoylglutathione lyase family enzyme
MAESAAPLARTHHIGMTVESVDAAAAFWGAFLGQSPRFRGLLDRPYLGRHVGYPGVAMDVAFFELPGGVWLELLDYKVAGKAALPEATANPGNVHVCLATDDIDSAWKKAVSLGARPIVPEGPIDVTHGPNTGARAAYLRIHDGITLELFQPPIRPSAEAMR